MLRHPFAPRAFTLAVVLAATNFAAASATAGDLPVPTGLQAQAVAAHGDGFVDDIQITWTAYSGFPANCSANREIRILRTDVEDVYYAAGGNATSFLDANLAAGTYTYVLQARCRIPAVPGVSPALNLVSDTSVSASATINNAPACAGAPSVAATATPTTLWPPNGKLVTISVSGSVTPQQNCAMPEYVSFAILDEYGEFDTDLTGEPLTNGAFAFTVQVEASRLGGDADGRHYLITLDTPDGGNNEIGVLVPHDQRKK